LVSTPWSPVGVSVGANPVVFPGIAITAEEGFIKIVFTCVSV